MRAAESRGISTTNVLKGYLETLRLFIARLAAAIIILPMTVRKVRFFIVIIFREGQKEARGRDHSRGRVAQVPLGH